MGIFFGPHASPRVLVNTPEMAICAVPLIPYDAGVLPILLVREDGIIFRQSLAFDRQALMTT